MGLHNWPQRNMELLTFVFSMVFLLHSGHGQLLYKMETQTGTKLGAGLDFGSVNVNLIAPNGTCAIQNLDNRGNTFSYGSLDELSERSSKDAWSFKLPTTR